MKTKIIAELGNVHEGSVGIAKSLIGMAKKAGADAVKFQMHIAEFESTVDEPFRVMFTVQDKTRFDYWSRVGFSLENWKFLRQHCEQLGIEFICTPFSLEAADLLERHLQVSSFKIGSGDAANWPLLEKVLSTGKTTMISTGLLSMQEIQILTQWISRNSFNNAIVLHCISQYPALVEKVSLPILEDIRSLHSRIGYSDHSGNLNVAKYALTIKNLEVLEIHLTPHKDFFGPDVSSSLTPEELEQLVQFRDTINVLHNRYETKDKLFYDALETRKIFRKGLFAARNIEPGEILNQDWINLRKPVLGIDSVDLFRVIGLKTKVRIRENQPIQWHDLEIELGHG